MRIGSSTSSISLQTHAWWISTPILPSDFFSYERSSEEHSFTWWAKYSRIFVIRVESLRKTYNMQNLMDSNIDVFLKIQRIKGHVMFIPVYHPPNWFICCHGISAGIWVCCDPTISIIYPFDQKSIVFSRSWAIYQFSRNKKTKAFEFIRIKVRRNLKAKCRCIIYFDCFWPKLNDDIHDFHNIFANGIISSYSACIILEMKTHRSITQTLQKSMLMNFGIVDRHHFFPRNYLVMDATKEDKSWQEAQQEWSDDFHMTEFYDFFF